MTSTPSTSSAGTGSPIPAEVVSELDRLGQRWSQLPLEQAVDGMPTLTKLLDNVTTALGAGPVPDLGPAVVMDQVRVLIWDACALGRSDGLADQLRQARSALARRVER